MPAGWRTGQCPFLNLELISGGWKVQKKASITQYHTDTVQQVMEEKEKIPDGRNSKMETNNTQSHCGRVEGTIKEKKMIPCGWIVRATPVTPNMMVA